MDIVCGGPLRAGSILWQPRHGAYALTVVCKATYVLAPSESPLADDPDDPIAADAYRDDDETRSLVSASDLAPFKPRADVYVVGHAHASRQRPVSSLVVRIIVRSIDKAIEVFPDRAWTQDGQLREGQRFLRMPLVYERAAGGPGTSNPVGIPANPAPDRFGMTAVPNLQPPGVHLAAPRQAIEPVGFAPIAPTWPSRMEKLHRYAATFPHLTWQKHAMPPDFDFGYFNAAPPDQQLDGLRPNERLVIEDLHAEHPRLVTSLPGVFARATVERRPGAVEEVSLRCDTLMIDTDRGRCTLTWRGQVAIEHPSAPGRITVTAEGVAPRPSPGRNRQTVDASAIEAARAALPFVRDQSSGVRPAPAPPPLPSRIPPPPSVPSVAPPPPLMRAPATPEPVLSIGQRAAAAPDEAVPRASRPEEATVEPAARDTVPPAATSARAIVSLLWFDLPSVARIRRKPGFRRILDEIEAEPPDDELDGEGGGATSTREEDRRDIFAIVARGAPTDAPGLREAVAGATRKDGSLVEPLVLVEGELRFPFDELETLKATVTAVTPLVAGDKALRDVVDTVGELLKTPWIQGSSGVAEGLTARLKEAFAQGKRVLPQGYLEAHTERMLLEQRHYQRRALFGKTWIRSLFFPAGATEPIPAYLPDALARELPLFQRFGARLIAELHLQQDQYEAHPHALRVVALARVVPVR
jgi:hypothetical protein